MGEYNDDEYDDRAQAGRGGRVSERIINFIESADGSVSLVTLTREEAETAIAAILAARDRPGLDVERLAARLSGERKSPWRDMTPEQWDAAAKAARPSGEVDVERLSAAIHATHPHGRQLVMSDKEADDDRAIAIIAALDGRREEG